MDNQKNAMASNLAKLMFDTRNWRQQCGGIVLIEAENLRIWQNRMDKQQQQLSDQKDIINDQAQQIQELKRELGNRAAIGDLRKIARALKPKKVLMKSMKAVKMSMKSMKPGILQA